MSAALENNQTQQQATPETNQKQNDKEHNFAQLRQQLERERSEKQQMREEMDKLKRLSEQKATYRHDDDDDDDEPYVDPKKLERKLAAFEKRLEPKIDELAEKKARALVEQERQNSWMKANPDFYEVMNHAQAFADKDPELAESILAMPEGFERQKLVYKNIKALGLHKKEEPKPSIQDKIDQNKRSAFYQPTGIGTAPYSNGGDFSEEGQKSSYQKMQALKKRLRI